MIIFLEQISKMIIQAAMRAFLEVHSIYTREVLLAIQEEVLLSIQGQLQEWTEHSHTDLPKSENQ